MAINFDGKGNIEATTSDGVIAIKLYSLEKTIEQKDQEIERLNNIINEYDKLIENEINESKLEDNYERVDSLEYCLATLRELKGSDK